MSISAIGNSEHPPVAGVMLLTTFRPTSVLENEQVNDH